MPTATRRRVLSLAALAAALWLLLPSPVAWAHATLLGSTPPAGYAVATPPTELTLDFDQPVSIATAPLMLADAAGHNHPLGRATLSLGNRRLAAAVPEHLANGGYRISWTVTAEDGDIVSGVITFAVGSGAAVPAGAAGGTTIDSPVVIVARWVLFTGLALALGGLVGDALARRVLHEAAGEPARDGPRPAVLLGAGMGALAAAALAVDQVGLDIGRLLTSPAGRVLAVELAAFLLALAVRTLTSRPARAAVGVPLVAVVLAEGFRAHPHAASPLWGVALTVVHLLAVAVWIGALVHVLRTAYHWRGHAGPTRLLVYDYSRVALVLVLVVIATGTLEALIVLPSLNALVDTTYGIVLLVKLALVSSVLVLAVLARRRLGRSRRSPGVAPLGRMVRGEAAVLVAVLATTAVLVSVAPAGPATTDLAAPPPPVGVVVPAGTLAGQITVIATASAGQLAVRMTTPDRGDLGSDAGSPAGVATAPDYRVAAVLTPEGQPSRSLTLRGCGAGCFTTPVRWQQGTNRVGLTITAPPWHGGTANLEIPWPPRTDPALLPAVLTAMRTFRQVTLHEAVSSDYVGYPGDEHASSLSGTDFLATEPYATGGGNPVILGTGPDETEIGLSFPEGEAIRLFVAADDRILREEDTTPDHLITITFEYPH